MFYMRLLRNVYQIAGPMYAVHQNVYAVKDGDSIIIIDTGKDEREFQVAQQNLKYWELDKYPISHVLLTHAHFEHSANAHRYYESGAQIVAHEIDAEGVEKGNDCTAAYAFTDCNKYVPCKVDLKVKDGDIIKTKSLEFEVIHVPGHSGGSVFYKLVSENKKILFTGDTVLTEKLCRESALGWTGGVDYNQNTYFQSLTKISTMTADVVLPGHGEVCMRDAGELMNGAYLKARLLLMTKPSLNLMNENLFRN